jgi:hypothetical protein
MGEIHIDLAHVEVGDIGGQQRLKSGDRVVVSFLVSDR